MEDDGSDGSLDLLDGCDEELFRRETKMGQDEWNRQSKEIERIVKEVEGEDDRSYGPETKKVQ